MWPHTNASLQWWQTAWDLKLLQSLCTAWILDRLTSVCLQLSRKLSRAFIPDEMKFKLLQQNGFENSLQCYMALGLKNLFKAGGVKLNKRETTLKIEVHKLSTHSELYFVFCFMLIPCLGVKTHTWRHYFPTFFVQTHLEIQGTKGNKLSSNDMVSQDQLICYIWWSRKCPAFIEAWSATIFPLRSTTTNFHIQSHTNTFCILYLCSYISQNIF